MEKILEEIKILKKFKIEYFINTNPQSSYSEFQRKIKERCVHLIEEIPIIIGGQHITNFLVGKVLNVLDEYDPKCEENLEESLKILSKNADCWIELGKCVWKRNDVDKAHVCFSRAVELERSARSLSFLTASMRVQFNRVDAAQRTVMINECLSLCFEALKLRSNYAYAWYSLGNTYLSKFFLTDQEQEKGLACALNAYDKALTISPNDPFINSDLHYGVALQYSCCYSNTIKNYQRALEIEPSLLNASKLLKNLEKYLVELNEGVSKKGGFSQRRLKQLTLELSKFTPKFIDSKWFFDKGGSKYEACGLDKLQEGDNKSFICNLKCLKQIDNELTPRTLVCVDSAGAAIGLAVYNCSSKFAPLVGDVFTVIRPQLVSVNAEVEGIGLNLHLIKVSEPCKELLKNGRPLPRDQLASTSIDIRMSVGGDGSC